MACRGLRPNWLCAGSEVDGALRKLPSALDAALRIRFARLLSAAVRAIVFTLFNQRLALPLEQVREVARLPPLSQVPRAPRALLGAMSLRGRILAVIAPEMLLEETPPWPEPGEAGRLLVIDSGESAWALRVASVEAICELQPGRLEADMDERCAGSALPWASLCAGPAQLPSGEVIRVLDLAALEARLDKAISAMTVRRPSENSP